MKTRPAIGNIESTDSKLYRSVKDKSIALDKFFSSVFTTEDPNITPHFHVNNIKAG